MPLSRFTKFAWFLLLYNLAAVAWGVFVRASKSGDGCGREWPLCDGKSIPLEGHVAKLVEGSHRLTTSLIGVFAIILLVWAFRKFPKVHIVRFGSVGVLGMTIVEGLIGAALVKYGWVTTNDSAARAAVMAFHVVSTFLLLGFLVITLAGSRMERQPVFNGQKAVGWILGFAGLGLCLLAISGAVSALGHQLKPVDNVLQAALNPATNWMVRLQPLHPLIAISIGLYILLAGGMIQHLRPDSNVRRAVRWMIGIYGVQLGLGTLNIWLKAPIPMQMLHLVVADVNWISLVFVGMFTLAEGIEKIELRPAPAELLGHDIKLTGMARVKAYIALTKPRVISLLLLTTLTAAIAAKGEWPGLLLFLSLAVGGFMAAGAANAINMVIDRDIDFTMKRTATRPTVTQAISTPNALFFAFALAVGSFAILWAGSDLLAAVMAFSGLVFYVIVYTMLLKRRTWHNIVIGGAAGAFPPLVGWAAVTDSLPPLSLYLFAIIFVWTPVHFWALAIMLKDEYAAAGVPMLPVVKGDRYTANQIAVYTAITIVVTMLPFWLPHVGWIYVGTAVVLNAVLIYLCVQLCRSVDRPHASSLFHYSMLYLAILFLMFAVDRTVVMRGGSANATAFSVKSPPFQVAEHQLGQGIVKVGNCQAVAKRERGMEAEILSAIGANVNGTGI